LKASIETKPKRPRAASAAASGSAPGGAVRRATVATVSAKFFWRLRGSITTTGRVSQRAMAIPTARRVFPIPIVW
jgi:hypothetical protein